MSATEVVTLETASLHDPEVRSHVYGALARAFSYPSPEMVTAWVENGLLVDLLRGINSVLKAAPEADIEEAACWVSSRGETLLGEDLSVDYTRLFITGTPRVIAPPYESVYADQGLLMGEAVSSAISAYREAGLAIQPDYSDLPDHLAAELEFMAYLAQAEHEAGEAHDRERLCTWVSRQRTFLADHLGVWAPVCLERVSAGADTPFYRLLAEVASRFVQGDLRRLVSGASSTIAEDD